MKNHLTKQFKESIEYFIFIGIWMLFFVASGDLFIYLSFHFLK